MSPILSAEEAAKDEKKVPKLLVQLDQHLGCVNCLRWSNSGTFLASGADDKLVMIWKKSDYGGGAIFGGGGRENVESWRCVNTLRGHNGDVLDLAWSPGDTLLATASVDNTVIIWNADKFPEIVTTIRGHTGMVKGVVFDPVGKYLASQSDDKTLRIWRVSDWREEEAISEPFAETGGTTHVLRPGWSPEGSMLVSAHAMNGGGPTAQIVERNGWRRHRDFVGHKKAISCVRFSQNIYVKERGDDDNKADKFVLVALGSKDRSISVWCTNLKRPLFVLNDIFDQSVVDVSWSRDGRILMACSMDGTVAAVVLKEAEIGRTLSEAEVNALLTQCYGKGFGLVVTKKKKKATTIVAENPELLKLHEEHKRTNGVGGFDDASKCGGSPQVRPKGPTDKQIEARTVDGKRRITPMFIPPTPTAEKSGAQTFGSGEFGSSSTQEKSQIEIEKRDDVVKPNVSPEKSKSELKADARLGSESERPVNVLQAKKKPTRIISSDSEDETSEKPDFASSNQPKKPELPTLLKRRTDEAVGVPAGESPKVKKRGRPPLNRAPPPETPESPQAARMTTASAAPVRAQREPPRDAEAAAGRGQPLVFNEAAPLLAPLTIKRNRSFTFGSSPKLTVSVCNHHHVLSATEAVHLVKCCQDLSDPEASPGQDDVSWENLFSSAVTSVHSVTRERDPEQDLAERLLLVTCADGSLHLLNALSGRMKLPPIMLPGAVASIALKGRLLLLVTTNAKLYLWSVPPSGDALPRALLKNECIRSLLQPACGRSDQPHVARLFISETEQPVVVTSAGKAFIYNPDLGAWLKLSDSSSAVHAVSSYSNAACTGQQVLSNGSLPMPGLPLSSMSLHTPVSIKLHELSASVTSLANVAHCDLQCAAAKFLGSESEQRYWLLAQVKHLAADGDVRRLRPLLDGLLHPSQPGKEDKELLRSALKHLTVNADLQRLYTEYSEQLNAAEEFSISDLL